MNHELAKTLTTALVQFIDREQPKDKMCVSSVEAEELERCFIEEKFHLVKDWYASRVKPKLTEFEQFMDGVIDDTIRETYSEDGFGDICKDALNLAKKQLLSYADESNPAIEAMADLERTFECNPNKLPGWLKDELTKRNLEGYIKGRNDALREMSDFMESHFDTKKAKEGEDLTDLYRKEYAQPLCIRYGGVCTNPMRDCINCIPAIERYNVTSGTSAATLHGNTSVTDGKEHNPSFTD